MQILAFLSTSVAEMTAPANRPKLWFGIWTGFAMAIGFGVLAAAASAFDLIPAAALHACAGLVVFKLATNAAAWFGLARDRAVLATQAINTVADVVLLTAAIYFTGGPYSPLLPTYVILVAVLSLLSNLGVTLLMSGLIVAAFSTMMILLTAGAIAPTAVPGAPGEVPTIGYAVTAIVYCGLVVGVPAMFSAATLRLLKRKEADLEARTAELIQASAQRSQFVASMTHELRTPIHGVQGLADVIAAGVYGPVTERQKDACASIKRSAQTLLALVDDVLQLARAEAGKVESRPTPVDVAALVERVTASASWIIGTKELTFEVEIADDLPPIESDERWLAHILINLLANAVKFTPERGRVTIRARAAHDSGRARAAHDSGRAWAAHDSGRARAAQDSGRARAAHDSGRARAAHDSGRARAAHDSGRALARDDAVELTVEDTGIGIAPEQRKRIFEPFRQLASGDDKGFGGVGLGLALVARLADLLGATVELDSVVGKGSTFRVIVPAVYRGKRSTKMMRAVEAPVD